jgi:hypothetical protein
MKIAVKQAEKHNKVYARHHFEKIAFLMQRKRPPRMVP